MIQNQGENRLFSINYCRVKLRSRDYDFKTLLYWCLIFNAEFQIIINEIGCNFHKPRIQPKLSIYIKQLNQCLNHNSNTFNFIYLQSLIDRSDYIYSWILIYICFYLSFGQSLQYYTSQLIQSFMFKTSDKSLSFHLYILRRSKM